MNRLKVGDRVKVVDSEMSYSIYDTFFRDNLNIRDRYKFSRMWKKGRLPKNNSVGTIISLGTFGGRIVFSHSDFIYVLKIKNRIYLMRREGIELVEPGPENIIALMARGLGLDVGEEFKLSTQYSKFKFDMDGGLMCFSEKLGDFTPVNNILNDILRNRTTIKKLPKDDEKN